MCVICIKPAGNSLPSKIDLEMMYRANPHGCGFATPKRFFKTLNFEEFMTELEKVKKNEPCIIHFRYATHGSIKVANCHPFRDRDPDTYFMHNGILNIRPVGDMTDSETAFRRYLAPCIKKYGMDSLETMVEVRRLLGCSKFAFLHKGKIYKFGNFEKYFGCWFSNMRWFQPMMMASGWF